VGCATAIENNPKPFTVDAGDDADKSSHQNAPPGLGPTTTLGIRFIRAISDGFPGSFKQRRPGAAAVPPIR